MDNNRNKRVIIFIIITIIVIFLLIMIILFTNKSNNPESVLSESSNEYENFCNQDRKSGRPNMDEIPEDMKPPEGMKSPAGMGNFSDTRLKIEEFCEDGVIDELLEDMPSRPGNNL